MLDFFSISTQNTAKTLSLCTSRPQTTFIEVFFYWDIKPVGHMRMGKPYDLVFTTKIVAVLTFLFTGRKKSVFLYTFAYYLITTGNYNLLLWKE